jgi:AbrB family looped-hinge helix DNA binding protein
MAKKVKIEDCCSGSSCCGGFKVEAILTVDARGQMVLPKELRANADIKAGDKLAAVSFKDGKKSCCICLVKADQLAGLAKELLGPLLKEFSK